MNQTDALELRVGTRFQAEIQDVAFGGDGVARVGEFVCFIPFVETGELVEAEVTELKKRFARGRLVKVIHPSPNRVEAPCPYFGVCGGCQYQHIRYERQLEHKHKQISELFSRIGGFQNAPIDPVVPCPQPYGYRNRIMIRSQWNKFKQGLNIGYVKVDSGLVVDIEECKIAEPALNEQIRRVRAHPPPKGGLKVVLRIPPEGWEVPRDSFFQNNFFLLPTMVDVVRRMVAESGGEHFVDVYCGVGFFALELAPHVKSFIGVEYDELAIRAARKNAINRKAFNGEFLAGAAEDLLTGVLNDFTPGKTSLLLDPPRKGCPPEALELLRQVRPAQLIYVSCHPATMARDLNILCRDSVYTLAKVVPLDMFPQTQHVECIADLRAGMI